MKKRSPEIVVTGALRLMRPAPFPGERERIGCLPPGLGASLRESALAEIISTLLNAGCIFLIMQKIECSMYNL